MNAASCALRQLVNEQVRANRAERKRQKEHDVVGRLRSAAEPLERRRDDTQAEQVLRKTQHAWRRVKRGRVPPRSRKRHRLRVPPENPGIQCGIACVVREHRAHLEDQRICQRDRDGAVHGKRQRGLLHWAGAGPPSCKSKMRTSGLPGTRAIGAQSSRPARLAGEKRSRNSFSSQSSTTRYA